MKRLLVIALLFLAGCSNLTPQAGLMEKPDDSNTHYTIPKQDANFNSNLQNFLGKEDAARSVDYGFNNFVVSGCLGATAAGLTHTLTACTAYNAGLPATCGVGTNKGLPVNTQGTPDCTGGNAITYPNASTCWVAMDENITGNNAGIPTFTRVAGTHYLIDCTSANVPAMVSDTQLLMEVTTSGGAITAVIDLRTTSTGSGSGGSGGCPTGMLCPTSFPYNAQGNLTNDDGPAFRQWSSDLCTLKKAGWVPYASKAYSIKTTDSNNVGVRLPCNPVIFGGGMDIGRPGAGNGIGAPHGTIADPTTYLGGAAIFCTQTSGVCVEVAYPGPGGVGASPPGNFGALHNLGIVGLGTDGATLSLSSVSAVTEASGAGPGTLVTGVTTTPIGLPIGSETGVFISSVTPSYALTGQTESQNIVTATSTPPLTGISLPQLALTLTVTGSNISGYNGTGFFLRAVGPCLATSITCGIAVTDTITQTNGTTTITDSTALFTAGMVGAAINIINQTNTAQFCTGTVASFISATQITVGGGCAGLSWTSSANFIQVAKALTANQFQYLATTSGLSAGTGGIMTQTGTIAGGETYNGPQYAAITGTNTFQFVLPYAGLGTVTGTGSVKLTTIGLSIGNANPNDVNYTYETHFNTYDVAVINFGMGAGFLEQNAQHYGMFNDRDYDGIFNEALNEGAGATNQMTFTGYEHAATCGNPALCAGNKGAKYLIDFRGYGGGNVWINPNLEYPDTANTAAAIVLGNQQESKVIEPFVEMGPSFIGEGIDILGRTFYGTVQIEGGQITGGETVGMHDYSGSNPAIKDVQITGQLILDTQVNCAFLSNNTASALTNNSTMVGCSATIQNFPTQVLACGGTLISDGVAAAVQKAVCLVNNSGGTACFPTSTADGPLWDTMELNYLGTMMCAFTFNAAQDGTSGQVVLDHFITAPGQALACSSTLNNPGTVNVYYALSPGRVCIQNNTSNAATTFMYFTFNEGVY